MRDLHLNDLADLLHLLVLQVLLHHQGLVPLGVDIAVPEHSRVETQSSPVPACRLSPVLLPESLLGWDGPLYYQDHPGPLSHPLVLDLRNLGVGVAHHSDQQVQQENDQKGHEDKPLNLRYKQNGVRTSIIYHQIYTNSRMFSRVKSVPQISKFPEGHDKH